MLLGSMRVYYDFLQHWKNKHIKRIEYQYDGREVIMEKNRRTQAGRQAYMHDVLVCVGGSSMYDLNNIFK